MQKIVICGSWCSGASEVADYFANTHEAYDCGPHVKMNDGLQASSYDPIDLAQLLHLCIDESTFELKANHTFSSLFREWLDKKTTLAKAQKATLLIIKHPLMSFFLDEICKIDDELEYVIVTRPFYKIDQRRMRRGWPISFGSSGAHKIYNKIYSFLHETNKNCTVIPFEKFRTNKVFRDQCLGKYNFKVQSSAFKLAEDAFLKSNLSAAASIISEAQAASISQSEITTKLLKDFYQKVKPVTPPDFSNIGEYLADVRIIEKPRSEHVSGTIVETREHKNLPFVIDNFFKHIDGPITIFHGKKNKEFIVDSIPKSQMKNIYMQALNCSQLNAREYNALFLTKKFWLSLQGRSKILIFQTDAMLANNSDFYIDDFLKYDCIGPAFERRRPLSIITNGGNGGLSLRDWYKSYACLNQFDVEAWNGGEDDFFNFHIELIGGLVAPQEACFQFGTQAEFRYRSFGIHQPRLLPESQKKKLIKWEPEAKRLL